MALDQMSERMAIFENAAPEAPEAAPEGDEAEPVEGAEAKPAEDEDEPKDEKAKLSGHKRQKAKIAKLEAELGSNKELIQKFHTEAMKVLEDNDSLVAELEDARREIAALRKLSEEYGVDTKDALDPRDIELAKARRELARREAKEKAQLEAQKQAQIRAAQSHIQKVAAEHGVDWRALAKGYLANGGAMTPEEVAAHMASGTRARKEAATRVARKGPPTHLNAESRTAASGRTYEDRVALLESLSS